MLIHVAIVEDVSETVEQFRKFFRRLSEEQPEYTFCLSSFCTADAFLAAYQPMYDLIMMDIEMPGTNGMDASYQLRKMDASVALMFVTNMAQFAVKGYEVDAFDFVVKPVTYPNFKMKMQRILLKLSRRATKSILLNLPEGARRILPSEILYIEVSGHDVVYHTCHGTYTAYGTLKAVEASLDARQFVRCNNCYLVNLNYVVGVQEDDVVLKDARLRISRARKKGFMQDLNNYLGGSM